MHRSAPSGSPADRPGAGLGSSWLGVSAARNESRPLIAVNGRFVTQPVTGVQRYAHELVSRLASASGWRVVVITPPREVTELLPDDCTEPRLDDRWWGVRGHIWEQTRLPLIARRLGADLLFGPAGWGPLWVRKQVVAIHDLHPIMHPSYFVPSFVRWARLANPALAHVPRRSVATSEHVAAQVVDRLKVRRGRIDLVPPAVGSPFNDALLPGVRPRPRDYCLFVGGDKEQKNLEFVLDFWPEVHRSLGLDLVVTERAVGSRIGQSARSLPGVRRVIDPRDDELAGLYAGALCLLWPSKAEGYGIPLLESMAMGTPFLSSDVGAAGELAIDPAQVLPLDAERWVSQITDWRRSGIEALGAACAQRAREATWERSVEQLVSALSNSMRSQRSSGG